MIWLNEITAIPTLSLWLLVFVGYWPHLRLNGDGPLHHMVRGVSMVALVGWMRPTLWDAARPALRYFEILPDVEQTVFAALANGLFNVISATGAYLLLVGLHRTLPDEARAHYTPLTAAFYPRRLTFFRKDK